MTEFRSDVIDELERLHAESTSGEWSNRDGRSYGIDADEEPVFESENSRDAAAIVALHNALRAWKSTYKSTLDIGRFVLCRASYEVARKAKR